MTVKASDADYLTPEEMARRIAELEDALHASQVLLERTAEQLEVANEELLVQHAALGADSPYFTAKFDALTRARSDILNILNSASSGMVLLDRDLKVRRFNEVAGQIASLDPGDVACPVVELVANLGYGDLAVTCREVMASGETREVEARTPDGRWYTLGVSPYRTLQGSIDGVVLTVTDVTALKERETALRKSEERFRLAASAATLGTYTRNLQTGEDHWSPEFLAVYGLGPGKPFPLEGGIPATLHPDDRAAVVADARARMDRKAEPHFSSEHRIILPDGEVRWVLVRGLMTFDAEGEPLEIHGVVMDITERQRAEEALRESEARLNAVLESLPVAVFIADDTGRIVRANPAAEELWGVPPETTSWEAYQQWVGYWPETDERIQAHEWAMARALREGETIVAEMVEYERFDTQERRCLLNNAAPIRDTAGDIIGGVAAELDVTHQREAEAELQRTVAQFEALFNQMTEGLILFDPEGNLVDMNPAALAIHGFDTVDSLQRHLTELTDVFELYDLEGHPLPTGDWPIGRVLRGETFDTYEVRVRRPDTGRTWIGSYGGTPVYGPDGELLLAIVTLRDVTAEWEAEVERERLLAEVERQAAELNATFEALPSGLILYGEEGKILRMNSAAERILGYTPETRGLPFAERLDRLDMQWEDGTPVSDFARLPPARALRGETVQGMTLSLKLPKDDVRRWFSVSAAPVDDLEGQVLGAVVSFVDITDRLRIQHQLEEANVLLGKQAAELGIQNEELERISNHLAAEQARLRAVLDALPVGVFIADAEGRFVEVNDLVHTIWGDNPYHAESAAEYATYRGVWADSGEPLAAEDWALARALAHGEVSKAEVIDIERFDGTPATILNSAAPIRDAEGRIIGGVAVVQDISERQRMKNALRDALQERTALLQEIHHRVKNNLAVVVSLLNLQAMKVTDPAARAALEESQRRIHAMARLHEHLYRSRDLAQVEMPPYIEGLCRDLRGALGVTGVELRVEAVPLRLELTTAIPCALILNELVTNAFKHGFGEEGDGAEPPLSEPQVVIGLDTEDGTARMSVWNNGRPLPDNFDMAASNSLGLSLVQLLAGQLRGTLSVRCDGGTAFEVTFPLAPYEGEATAEG